MSERDDSSKHTAQANCSHEEVRALLPGFAAARALGQMLPNQYVDVYLHVQSCAACLAELEALLQLVRPIYRGQVAPAGSYPHFNLAFLQRPPLAVRGRNWFIDHLQRLVVEFSDALLAELSAPPYAQAARGAALYRYTPDPAPPGDLEVTVDVFADDGVPDQGSVQVLIDVPSRDPFDQSGTRVRLQVGEAAWQGVTGTTGSVTFTSVPLKQLPQLRLEIVLSPEPE